MDPLSMTASIATVGQLTSTLVSYIIEATHATREQKKVAVEASNLYSLLIKLRFRVEEARHNDEWFNQVKLLGVENGLLDQFKYLLEKMVDKLPSPGKSQQLKSALWWKFTKKEVEDVLARMERLKSLINCALTNDLFALSKTIHGDTLVVKQQTERVQSLLEQDLQNKLSRWLSIPDPSANYHTALGKRHPETGQWLLNGQHFAAWKSSTSSLMWLHGSAGCGKTVLSAASLHHILQHKEPDTIVSYFYFDFNDIEKQSSNKAIRSLLFQIATQATDIAHELELLYGRCSHGQQQPAEDVIHSLFRKVMDTPREKYIVLDALDECTDREGLLTFLRELIASKPRDLRVLATSRRERDIDDELSPVADYNINILQSAVVDEDIRVYIRDRMATDKGLKKWPDPVQTEITTALMEKADGMFRKTLSSLPKTLDETYNRILRDLESNGQLENAIKALQWLCFSKRPLRLIEMAEILAIETGDQGGFNPEERLPDPMDIMVVCSSLISLNPINGDWGNDKDGDKDDVASLDGGRKDAYRIQIQLAHFSVQEFLLSDRCAFNLDFRSDTCHAVIAESCLHYFLHLCQDAPVTGKLSKHYPLLFYAAEEWWQHLQAITGVPDDRLLDHTLRLVGKKDVTLLSWVQLSNVDRICMRFGSQLELKDIAEPLYYAASIGVAAIVEKILRRNIDVNAQGGYYDHALQAASINGHETVVQMLLDAGANVNAQGGLYGNALQAASSYDRETVVRILLDAGANVNAQGGGYGNALQAARLSKHETVVQILLDAGARE
ncbi:uncharacterized protein A1O5_08293 [Cladophialophora psammophila CBS 110553]|uniref:NACHT domain-containing protein n=1 Tax=Cladophialophora psammophila CBS 110553 TaxID=1182543 RepID=W9WTZ7_9EURO|nr:uncharacterized protein A1O5_08293 [Cladophialophora psammophila CBS 110553]EXJ68500.1 hypothetical protein A1O5_08293 [Cladophialophora psammophila CBS 110553]